MKKLAHGFNCWQEYELAPGLTMTIRSDCDGRLEEVVGNFLRRKASIGEVRKILRARECPRIPDMVIATSNGDK